MKAVILLTYAPGKTPKAVHWKDSQKLMGNPTKFIDSLTTFNGENINDVNKNNVK